MKNSAAIRESYLLLVISGLSFDFHFHSLSVSVTPRYF